MKNFILALMLLWVAMGCDKEENTSTPQAEDWRKSDPTRWTTKQVQTIVREKLEKEYSVRLNATYAEFRWSNLGA